MTTYGWYYEGESLNDQSGDLWQLIELAVRTALNEGRRTLDVRVGPMVDADIRRLIDQDDIEQIFAELEPRECNSKTLARHIVECVGDRHADEVTDGEARTDKAGERALMRIMASVDWDEGPPLSRILEWAHDHIEIEPDRYCEGDYALPVVLVDGKWRHGPLARVESQATITYAEATPETAHEDWCWRASGKTGQEKTLQEAMAKCEELVKR